MKASNIPFSVCVYCGSRSGTDPAHEAAARRTGEAIGARGWQLVYGGGRSGLMGTVAEAARCAGARVIGAIPRSLVERELANRACDELHIVETMHERKALMAEHADAFVALPGGIGTFEELFEVWTWKQLQYHHKPIGLLNAGGYYDSLLAFLEVSVDNGFIARWQMDLIHVGNDVDTLLEKLHDDARKSSGTSPPLRDVI